jgi:hypothetical protein
VPDFGIKAGWYRTRTSGPHFLEYWDGENWTGEMCRADAIGPVRREGGKVERAIVRAVIHLIGKRQP